MLWGDDFRDELLGAFGRRRQGDSGDSVEDAFDSADWVNKEVFSERSCYPSSGWEDILW